MSGHHEEWLQACRTGKLCSANFEYSGWLTEANHLGNVAYRVGKTLEWNAEAMRAANAPEAEPFLTRQHRRFAHTGARGELGFDVLGRQAELLGGIPVLAA